MVCAGRAFQGRIHLELEAVDLAGGLNAADLVVVSVSSHCGARCHLGGPYVAVDGGSHLGVEQAFRIQLIHEAQIFAGFLADAALKIFALFIIVAQRARAGG